MIAAAQPTPLETGPFEAGDDRGASSSAWDDLRGDSDIQFAPVDIPEIAPREPSWFEKFLDDLFEFMAELLAPVGQALAGSWFWLQWVLLAVVIGFALVLLVRMYGPGAGARRQRAAVAAEEEWQPDRAASLALLEDADRLAAEGRFDEATRLLLQRSVGHIAAARPDWVEPSSTARELAALPALPDTARAAFRVMAERVERSLFALRSLDRVDWETARAAYAEFALARLTRRELAA